jgi:uncharacterized phiE125 gp8 family phage protein
VTAWDLGVCWRLDLETAPDPDDDPLTLAAVRDDHLHAAAGDGVEDTYIASLMTTSLRMAERGTWRSLLPMGWVLVMDRFPCWEIVLPRPPLVSVSQVVYVDTNGVEQTLTGSPAQFEIEAPRGPTAPKGRIWPLYGQRWPATRCQPNAVRVHFTAGYPLVGSPAVADVPDDITQGRLLVIGELYKQRSESVHAFNQNPAVIRAQGIWDGYKAY